MTPSPYGRHRPRRTRASGSRSSSSVSSRDFPTPAWPKSVTSCGTFSRSTRAATASRTAISWCRPMNGPTRSAGRSVGSAETARAGSGPDVRLLALHTDVSARPVRHRALRGRVGAHADEHLAGLRMLLQAGGDVDRVTADHQLPACRCRATRDDLAGVHTDSQADLGAVVGAHPVGEGGELLMRCERCPNCTLRIVLVCLRDAEDGEDRIPDELLGRATEPLDLRVQHPEELALQFAHLLGVELPAECGRTGEIGEEHGDDAPLLPLVGADTPASALPQRKSTRRTEPRRGELLGATGRTRPVYRGAAGTAETRVRGLRGLAGGANDLHEPSLRRSRGIGSARALPRARHSFASGFDGNRSQPQARIPRTTAERASVR